MKTIGNSVRWVMGVLLFAGAANSGWAWGPVAQHAITETAIKIITKDYKNAFQTDTIDYYKDITRGASSGLAVLRNADLIKDERTAVERVSTEMELLRAVRDRGVGSYFAYRMGVLSTLVADILLPFGLDRSEAGMKLQAQIEHDIDAHIRSYTFQPLNESLHTVRYPNNYMQQFLDFRAEAKVIIQGDYAGGVGYNGFMAQAGPKYFQDAIRVVAEVWNTILSGTERGAIPEPSAEAQTWYCVDEIAYQLKIKNNRQQANRAFTIFSTVNPGIMEAYETVGDLFYDNGDQEHGVREWQYALQFTGGNSDRIVDKLCNHYLGLGRLALGKAAEAPVTRDGELLKARRAFEQALQYKRTSQEAVDMLAQTNTDIRERDEQRSLVLGIVTGAQEVQTEAQQAVNLKDFGTAIVEYQTAMKLFESVDQDFPEQYDIAQKSMATCEREIKSIIGGLITDAIAALADGDNARDAQRWDDAQRQYERVPVILNPIPDGFSKTTDDDKNSRIKLATDKLMTLKVDRERWESTQGPNRPAGAAAGAAAPAAPAAAPAAPAAPARPGGPPRGPRRQG